MIGYYYTAMALIAILGAGGAVAVLLPINTARLDWIEPCILALLGTAVVIGYLQITTAP